MSQNPNSTRPKRFMTHSCRTKKPVETVTHQGLTLSIPEWADRVGLSRQCLRHRIKNGWSSERALTEPKR